MKTPLGMEIDLGARHIVLYGFPALCGRGTAPPLLGHVYCGHGRPSQLLSSFLCCRRNTQNLSQTFHLKGLKTCFFSLPECPAFTAVATGHKLSLVISSLKSVCCDFSIFSAVMPRLPARYLTWYGIHGPKSELLPCPLFSGEGDWVDFSV